MLLERLVPRLVAVLVVTGLTIQGCAHRPFPNEGALPAGGANFDPPFITADKATEVRVSLKLKDSTLAFPDGRIVLEKWRGSADGSARFVPIGELRDNGLDGDLAARDGTFTGRVTFSERASGTVYLRALGMDRGRHQILASPLFALPVYLACGPTGHIMPVRIFEGSKGKRRFEPIKFDVPKGGKAILRLVNGARVDGPLSERINYARIAINGRRVRTITQLTGITEVPVHVVAGSNALTVERALARGSQRMSVGIDVCPDKLELQPVPAAQLVGERLAAEARVSGLGVPVGGGHVRLEVAGIGQAQQATVSSSGTGAATTTFAVTSAGTGTLRATLIGATPPLIAETPIRAVAAPSIVLNEGRSEVTVNAQAAIQTPFFLLYLMKDGLTRHLVFQQTVEPNVGGISLTTNSIPPGGFVASRPTSFTVEEAIRGLHPGTYRITSLATIQETGETASTSMTVTVIDPGAPLQPVLGAPSIDPPAVAPTARVRLKFMSLVSGASTPPDVLFLDKVDATGNVLVKGIAQLRDDGRGEDKKAGDLTYTGTLEVNASSEGESNYRVRAHYYGKSVTSGTVAFGVTRFPLTPRPSDPTTLVSDPESGGQIFSNEVIATVLPGVSEDRVNQIAAAARASVVGAIPTLRTFLLETPRGEGYSGVQNALATLRSFSELKDASPNGQPVPAAFPVDPPNDPYYSYQWDLTKIRAHETWQIAGGGDPSHAVAILDIGVNCSGDLNGQCAQDDAANSAHGTQVAEIIAAKANNNTGTVGVAYDTRLYAYPITAANGAYTLTQSFVDSTLAANAKVINVSHAVHNNPAGLCDSVRRAFETGHLVVVPAVNVAAPGCDQNNWYPAQCKSSTGDGLLVIGATDTNDNLATWTEDSALKCSNTNLGNLLLYAPGKDIAVANYPGSFLATVSGTSFATALTSGAAAVLWASLASSAPTPQQVQARLVNKADGVALGGSFGSAKRLNLFNAVATKKITINFQYENADFHNMYGYYVRDSSNNPKEAHLLVENVDLDSNPSLSQFTTDLYLTDQRAASLEFFLIPNGAQVNGTYLSNVAPDERRLMVFLDSDGNWRLKDANSTVLRGATADAFFTEKSRNPDAMDHIRRQKPSTTSAPNSCGTDQSSDPSFDPNNYVLCWEDLASNVSDRDYNDAQFRINKSDN